MQICEVQTARQTGQALPGHKWTECGGERKTTCASSFPQTVKELNELIESGQDFTLKNLCANFDRVKGESNGTSNPVCINRVCVCVCVLGVVVGVGVGVDALVRVRWEARPTERIGLREASVKLLRL